ncbi:MAG: Gfo/Idh/MocA family oxidoreductase, partial [Bacteroidales bacterium]|nr:Gfo/Idh/MocA family oxidoreductase [Bacteroidales bacterium]
MAYQKPVVGFIGAGGIAHSHAYALNSMTYYYTDSPEIVKEAVCSASRESRELFAKRYDFRHSVCTDDFFRNERIDTVFILGPNKVHTEHLDKAAMMPSVKRIYIEKPLCATLDEELKISQISEKRKDLKIQVGFQFLFSPAVREALH